ncbi:MAG TPA: LamG-like jellyroll fold domain-containing protein [Pirellulaceae bacterium]|nr:LamG-like jellyroll fold domain-containing protein [Pirellulaceae bacterium]
MSTPESLIHRYLDDRSSLDAAELDELIALLRAEPARAAALREQLLLDDLLAQKLAVDRRIFQAQVGQRIADFHRGQAEMDDQVSELRALAESEFERPTTWSGSSPWVKYIALAATVLIAAVIFVPRWLPRTPQPLAKVTAMQGDVQVAGQPAAIGVGRAVLSGQQIVTPDGASLAIEYADKTTVQIAGGSTVTLDIDDATGGKRVAIEVGAITAVVSPQGAGAPMKLTTPHAVATVVGTEFRLTVSATTTLLDVTEGKVLLDRLADKQSIAVGANETGLASSELLQVRPLAWPEDHRNVAYIYTPFDFLTEFAPVSASRNPMTSSLRDTPLELSGATTVNEFTSAVEFQGGHARSDDAGVDLLASLSDKSELTIEIVFSATTAEQEGPARIVALADDGQAANFALLQDGQRLGFQLLTDAGDVGETIWVAPATPTQTSHIAIAYRDGSLVIYRDGEKVTESDKFQGSFSMWRGGPLTLGADASGQSPWLGTIEAIAIHSRCLEEDEIARNARSYRLLARQ